MKKASQPLDSIKGTNSIIAKTIKVINKNKRNLAKEGLSERLDIPIELGSLKVFFMLSHIDCAETISETKVIDSARKIINANTLFLLMAYLIKWDI